MTRNCSFYYTWFLRFFNLVFIFSIKRIWRAVLNTPLLAFYAMVCQCLVTVIVMVPIIHFTFISFESKTKSMLLKCFLIQLISHISIHHGCDRVNLLLVAPLEQLAVAIGVLNRDAVPHGECHKCLIKQE